MTFQEAPTGRQAVSAANPNNTNDKLSKLKVFKRGRSLELSKWYMGILTTKLAQPEDTNGAFFLVEATLSPGTEPHPHVHSREDELFYVLEGGFDMYVGEEAFQGDDGRAHFSLEIKAARIHYRFASHSRTNSVRPRRCGGVFPRHGLAGNIWTFPLGRSPIQRPISSRRCNDSLSTAYGF